MRIAGISPRPVWPPQRGGAVRMYHLLRHLSAWHAVRQLTPAAAGGGTLERLRITPRYHELRFGHPLERAVRGLSERAWPSHPILAGPALALARPAMLDRLLRWCDLLLVDYPWQLEHCAQRAAGRPVVLASHNVEAQKFASFAQAAGVCARRSGWIRCAERAEARAVARADLVLAVSPEDRREFLERYGLPDERVVEIPNGADTESFQPVDPDRRAAAKRRLGLPLQRPVVLFVQGPARPSGLAAVRWLRALSERAGRFSFVVAGSLFRAPRASGNLIVTGRVEDIRSWFHAADLFLCPIEFGGGTKIKLLEALACGLPTVAFAESLRGTGLRDGMHVRVAAKGERSLLAALDALVDDPSLAAGLARHGRKHVVEHFDWQSLASRLDAALRRLAPEADGATRAPDQSAAVSSS